MWFYVQNGPKSIIWTSWARAQKSCGALISYQIHFIIPGVLWVWMSMSMTSNKGEQFNYMYFLS